MNSPAPGEECSAGLPPAHYFVDTVSARGWAPTCHRVIAVTIDKYVEVSFHNRVRSGPGFRISVQPPANRGPARPFHDDKSGALQMLDGSLSPRSPP